MSLTVADYDRRIAFLRSLLAEENRKRKALKMAIIAQASWADPESRAMRVRRIQEGNRASARALPEMSVDQRRTYIYLTKNKRLDRPAALSLIFPNSGGM